MNGIEITGDSIVPSAFVEQEVDFFPHMTVRETLRFRVELKLGSHIRKKARDAVVDSLIAQLRLGKAADTVVGDSRVRGISGGERRRLSIACELISSPSLIFLDEPTSGKWNICPIDSSRCCAHLSIATPGLDSTAATNLVETLRALADSGKTIVAVIHQPSQHVFSAFDDLLLVSEGKQVYFGEVSEVRSYMETHARNAPEGIGTAEHVLDCISKAELPGESKDDAQERLDKLASVAITNHIDVGISEAERKRYTGGVGTGPRANILTQFRLLLGRSLRENFRGKAKLVIQTVQQVSLGLIYGGIYSLGTNQVRLATGDAVGIPCINFSPGW